MKWYPWLRQHFEQLIKNYKEGCENHALLIKALPSMGYDSLIYAISRFLICQQPYDNKSCGKCRCCQLMQAGTYPDYYLLEPDKGKSSISIDAVREVNDKLYQHALLSGTKIVWIKDAELLTYSAVNALLKILEEPLDKTWFFLSCREPSRLLATLRSRCRLYNMTVPPEKFALAWLIREVPSSTKDAALAALRICSGAPATALALLQPEVWSQREQLCHKLHYSIYSSDWLSILNFLNQENTIDRLHWLASLILDALKIQQMASLISNTDVFALVNMLAHHIPGDTLQAILNDICECRKELLTVTGLNIELLLTGMLLRIEQYLLPAAAGATLLHCL